MGTRRATEDDMRKKQVYNTYATKLCNPASKKKLHAPILILDETNPNSPVENWGEILPHMIGETAAKKASLRGWAIAHF